MSYSALGSSRDEYTLDETVYTEQELISEVYTLLSRMLPDYMHSSQIIIVEDLPLIPNGEIDRNAWKPRGQWNNLAKWRSSSFDQSGRFNNNYGISLINMLGLEWLKG